MSAYNNDDPNSPDDLNDDFNDLDSESFESDEVPLDEEDEWADQASGEENPADAPVKKKSPVLLYGIILLVVLGGGAFAFMSMTGGSAPAEQAAVEEAPSDLANLRDEATQEAQLETPAPVPEQQPQEAASAEGGFMNTPAGSDVTPPPALPDSSMTAVEDTAATPPSPESLPETGLPAVKPMSDFPSVDLIKKPDAPVEQAQTPTPAEDPAAVPAPDFAAPATETPVEAPAEPAPVMAAPVAAGADPAQIAELQEKLTASQTRVAELEKSLQAAQQQKADPGTAAADAKTISDLEAKVADLEGKLAAHPAVQAEAQPASQPKPAVSAAPPRAKAPAATAKPSSKVISSWQLRGAQPGQAMLANRNGDIRSVSVGDSLPGLGKILSVEQSSSGWVVRGTQGRVVQ